MKQICNKLILVTICCFFVNDADPKIRETVKERHAKRKEVHQLGGGVGSKIYKPSTYYMYDFTIVFSVNPLSSFGVYSVI